MLKRKIKVRTIEFDNDEELAYEIEFIEAVGWTFIDFSWDSKALSDKKYVCKTVFRRSE